MDPLPGTQCLPLFSQARTRRRAAARAFFSSSPSFLRGCFLASKALAAAKSAALRSFSASRRSRSSQQRHMTFLGAKFWKFRCWFITAGCNDCTCCGYSATDAAVILHCLDLSACLFLLRRRGGRCACRAQGRGPQRPGAAMLSPFRSRPSSPTRHPSLP